MRLDLHTMIPHELTLSLEYIYNLMAKLNSFDTSSFVAL